MKLYFLSLSFFLLSYLLLQLVNKSQKYGHPANWSGYMLLGKDIILRDRAVDLARSLRSMLQAPQDYLIAGLKTLQAMVSHVTVM